MGQLFIKVLNLSIVAGWLVLAIVVLRAVFRKVPKWIYCSLWALVGLRLIFPFSLQSMFSVIPSTETVPQDIVYSQTPEIHTGLAAANSYINPVIKDTFSPEIGDSVNPLQVWMEVIGIVWLIGIAGMLMFALVSYLKLRKKTSAFIIIHNEAIDFENNSGNGNFKCKKEIPYPVYACDDIDSPFILGLFRPKIFIPSDMDQVNLESVYSHEMAHIERKDFLWKPLGFLILTVYWFNPLMWVAYILLCRDIEGACDEKVINSMDSEGRVAYSQALLNCGTHTRRFSVCPLSFGETGVKSRVKSVLNYKKPALWVIFVALIACVVIGICFLTDPQDNVKGVGVDNGNDNREFFEELNPTTSPVMETVYLVSEIDADGKLIYSYSTDLSEDENNIRGKVYIWNDEGGDNHNNLLNNIFMLRLYSDGKATYSQPIYSSHAPFNVTWETENNTLVITEGSQVNYFDIADGGLKFRKEGSSGFMFYDIPDGAFFKWEYNLTDAKAENS